MVYMCPRLLLANMCDVSLAGCASAVVHVSVDIAKLWLIYCYCLCAIISLHLPSYNIPNM